jgi:deoxyribonuclease IV
MVKKLEQMLLLGAHMSIAGGFRLAIKRAESIHATCLQIFTKSNKQWSAKDLTYNEIEQFKQSVRSSTIIQDVIAHASYLINLGSPDKSIEQKSVHALAVELLRCQALGIPYLVIHPGAHLNSSVKECLDQISDNINIILEENPGDTSILLENTAGQGTTICYTFEHLAIIYNNIFQKERVGFCFDTCHAFAAGYDFSTPKTYQDMWRLFDKKLGLNNLKVIHVNDSKRELGSNIDRHEHIGKGKIGLSAFKLLFNDKNFFGIPKILETPRKDDSLLGYAHDMETIYGLLNPGTKKVLNIL